MSYILLGVQTVRCRREPTRKGLRPDDTMN